MPSVILGAEKYGAEWHRYEAVSGCLLCSYGTEAPRTFILIYCTLPPSRSGNGLHTSCQACVAQTSAEARSSIGLQTAISLLGFAAVSPGFS